MEIAIRTDFIMEIRQVIKYQQHQHFYDRIFKWGDNSFLRRIRQILLTAQNYKDVYTVNNTDALTFAAADFAREMTNRNCVDDSTDFKNYCAYFEFVFTEFKFIHFVRFLRCIDHNICIQYLLNNHYNGPLLNVENNALSANAFIGLSTKYDDFHKKVGNDGMVYTKREGLSAPEERYRVQTIRQLARDKRIKFRTKPLAVYHWRKHTIQDLYENHLTRIRITPRRYLRDANDAVVVGEFNKNLTDSTCEFKFISLRDLDYLKHKKVVAVTANGPIALVSYFNIAL
jgi:hypothetical protein